MRKIAMMALPLFALSMSACSDDSGKNDLSTTMVNHDFSVQLDGPAPDLTTPEGDAATDGSTTPPIDMGFKSTFPAPPMLGAQIDRFGRPAVNTALTDPFWDDGTQTQAAHRLKLDAYNAAPQSTWATTAIGTSTVLAIFKANLAVFDALSGTSNGAATNSGCGDQVGFAGPLGAAYTTLATVLADDRLWLNTGSGTCTEYLAVELSTLGKTAPTDCGGRTPTYDVIDITYSALAAASLAPAACVTGTDSMCGVNDGVNSDPDSTPSLTAFPFLGAP